MFETPFFFLRHGETESNRLGLIAGQSDVELNETGWRQARAAAEQLRGCGIEAIYSSPLKRARDSAGCVAAVLSLPIVVVPGIAERNWGTLEGKPTKLRVRESVPPGGEGPDDFARRTLAGLATITEGAVPLVVAHSGTYRVLLGALDIAPPEKAIDNCMPLRFLPPASAGGAWAIQSLC